MGRAAARAAMLALAGTLAFAVAGCGTHRHSVALPGPALTIYTSLPLDAEDGARAQDVAAAERLALEQAGGRAGGFRIALAVLDDATTATGTWDPGLTQLNARRAADDPTTIAYLGEFSGGASAISVPITNEAGILQLSPADSLLGLTRNGGSPGEPERYYPTGQRTFARLVPSDEMQAEAISRYMMAEHVRRLLVLDDQGNEGASLGLRVARGAALHHIDVVNLRAIDPHATDFSSLAASVAAAHVDAICFAGDSTSMAPLLFNQLAAADPSLRLFGSSGVNDATFAASLNPLAAQHTFLVSPALPQALWPSAGNAFAAAFYRRFGHNPDPYARYGFEAMRVVLAAITAAGPLGNGRAAVIGLVLGSRQHSTVLGNYTIDADGDVSAAPFAGLRVRNGSTVLSRLLSGSEASRRKRSGLTRSAALQAAP